MKPQDLVTLRWKLLCFSPKTFCLTERESDAWAYLLRRTVPKQPRSPRRVASLGTATVPSSPVPAFCRTLLPLVEQGKILEKTEACSQIAFTRYVRSGRKPGPDPQLSMRDARFGRVPGRVYRPRAPSAGLRAGAIFCHGGGWLYCSFGRAGRVVPSPAYHLAPEHKYPAAYEDCLNATIHFMKHMELYGVDPANVIVCRDSAGGNIAAAVSQTLAGRSDLPKLCAQILIYPGLQALDFNLPSYQQNQGVPLLFRERAAFYMLQYLNGNASNLEEVLEGSHIPIDIKLNYRKWVSPDNIPEKFKVRGYKPHVLLDCTTEVYETVKRFCEPNLCPLLAEDALIQQLPETFMLTCEYDVLRDDGLLYKKRLEDNGVRVTWGLDSIVKFIKGL
uniref:Alpha/beta hydrolase fold-3 domain-containing protein n=1 Tax=Aquila chrysaetos chrysaetos TaxID=223781 RepID=A0A663DLM4_AQUCH